MVKFLIIRFSSIGDIVLTSPVVRILKTQVEGSEIQFLTKLSYKGLLDDNPYIQKIHSLNEDINITIQQLLEEEFDYIIDLQNNITSLMVKRKLKRMYFTVNKLNLKKWIYVNFKINLLPEKHIVDRYLETLQLFDIHNDNKGLDFFIPDNYKLNIAGLPEIFHHGYIAMVIGAKHETKKLPLSKIIRVIEKLKYPIILIGGEEDIDAGEHVISKVQKDSLLNGCGRWNIQQSASIIEQSNCVITHDTGMMHIAAAFEKKIISIWGNTLPVLGMYPYHPDKESIEFEVENLNCRPCSKLGKNSCPKKHFKCMEEQSVSAIADSAMTLFESYAALKE